MSLGEHLRSIRSRLDPAALGLPGTGARRVSGLRREEVAVLAGMSADYYTRLEQGREQNPSVQILEALARGLDLDGDEREHLFHLAGYRAPLRALRQEVRPELARLLGRWQDQAAFVLNGTLDVLAPNALARALFYDFSRQDNLARMVFLDPVARTFYADWECAAESVVADLRHRSRDLPAAVSDSVVQELGEASEEFRQLWAQQRVRGKTHAVKRFRHRGVGELTLAFQALDVPDSPGWQIIPYDAELGTASAEAFALLRASSQLRASSTLRGGESAARAAERPL